MSNVPPRHLRQIERARAVLGNVLDPDRLHTLRSGADDRRHRREPRETDEGRQDAAVAPEDKTRPEDHVLDRRLLHSTLHLPLRREVRHLLLRALVQPERAREHEAADARFLCSRDEVARALRHHTLEVGTRALE